MRNSEVLDSDGSVRFPKRAMWISFLILLAMGAVIYLWFSFSETKDWSNISLGDIGAILSGTFTALAWYWFIEAYLLQSKELALQRKTLETQVEELKQSVRAQQGSEQALHIQSNALTKQLSITEKQFKISVEEKVNNKPRFVAKIDSRQLGQICDRNFNRQNFELSFDYMNKRGQAIIRDVECTILRSNHTDAPIVKFLEQQLFEVTSHANTITISSEFSLHNLVLEQIALGHYVQDFEGTGGLMNVMQRILIDILILCELSIYYDSTRLGLEMEKYGFYYPNQKIILSKSNTQTISTVGF